MVTFQKVNYYRLYEKVITQIEQFIEEGKLGPGDQLPPERELAAQLAISRGTLREAFRVLENRGIIESRPGGGRYIRRLLEGVHTTASDIFSNLQQAAVMDLLEAREMFETQIIEIACARATQADLDLIEATLAQMKKKSPDHAVTIGLDQTFHLAIAAASHNIVFENIIRLNLDLLAQIRAKTLLMPNRVSDMFTEHFEIYKALKSRDPFVAKAAMERHLHCIRDAWSNKKN